MAPIKDVQRCSKGLQYKNKADCEANGGSWDSFASTLTDYAANPSIFQQTFLGLSIMDFSANIGFNSNSSSLSVNLVKDEVNFEQIEVFERIRDLKYKNNRLYLFMEDSASIGIVNISDF